MGSTLEMGTARAGDFMVSLWGCYVDDIKLSNYDLN